MVDASHCHMFKENDISKITIQLGEGSHLKFHPCNPFFSPWNNSDLSRLKYLYSTLSSTPLTLLSILCLHSLITLRKTGVLLHPPIKGWVVESQYQSQSTPVVYTRILQVVRLLGSPRALFSCVINTDHIWQQFPWQLKVLFCRSSMRSMSL